MNCIAVTIFFIYLESTANPVNIATVATTRLLLIGEHYINGTYIQDKKFFLFNSRKIFALAVDRDLE